MSLKTISLRSALLGSSATAVLAMSMAVGGSAMAQDEGADEEVEQVVVTGSRIVRKDLQSASPVTVINAEEVTQTGTTRIEDLVTALPQAFAAQNSTVANGSSGTATVSLRKLGSTRTLVLINGRRAAAGDPFNSAFDMNFIPAALVKRVDVLTGGASAVYGADAVAGVVNFVLDTDFEGLKMDAQYSFYQHNNSNKAMQDINNAKGFDVPTGNITDGKTKTISMAAGSSFADGRGHASAYVNFRDIGSITKANRDYTNCSLNRGSSGPVCGGSSTSQYGRFDFKIGGKLKAYVLDWDTGNELKPRSGEVFNYGPLNHIQRPDQKFAAGGFLNYQVNDKVEAYIETMFMDDYTRAQIAPTGSFRAINEINCNNPLMSSQQFNLICVQSDAAVTMLSQADYNASFAPGVVGDIVPLSIKRRNIEGGNRTNIIRHTSYRLVAGFKGQLDDTWSYDVYGMYSQNLASESYINDGNNPRMQDSQIIVSDPDTGAAVCASGNAGCVPWNLFSKGAVTQEALDYIKTVGVMSGFTKSQILSGSVVGDLGDYDVVLPNADEGVQVAIGIDYRKESLTNTPDEVYSKGLRSGGGGSNTASYDGIGFSSSEIFGEAVVPILQGHEMAQDLALELGFRYAEHSLTGGASTYKALMTWQVNDDIKFRGGYNRAVRSPNLLNLFAPQNHGLGGNTDICANLDATGLPTASAAECAFTGAGPSLYGNIPENPANQYNTLTGGNPNLKPEIADTFTFGGVFTPAAVPGFSLTLDYYKININDTIGSLGADDIIQTCATTGDANLCSLIHRDGNGTLWMSIDGYTESTQQNIGKLGAEGIDVNMNYNYELGDYGNLNFSLIGTYLLADSFSDPLTSYDCVALFGNQCGSPSPKWKHKARLTWETTFDSAVSFSWRFTGASTNDDFSDQSSLLSTSNSNLNLWVVNGADYIKQRSFYDLSVSHQISESVKASIGVNNILDSEPPLLPTLTSTGFTGSYDTLGRYVFMGVKAHF